MVTINDYGQFETAWCPGCGNHSILQAVKKALTGLSIEPHEVLFISGIGQAAKAPHYLRANVFNGLHGRSLPVATGAKTSNPDLAVIVESGDGCNYGEGGNHFLAAIRRNVDITVLVHNNQVYGLTKGQASPTTSRGVITKAQPEGALSKPFNPLSVAVAMGASFAARGFSGDVNQLALLIQEAVANPGFSLVDILHPCVSFNKINTFAWYKERCQPLPPEYDPRDWEAAIKTACQWGDQIPTGIIYRSSDQPTFGQFLPFLSKGPLARQGVDRTALKEVMSSFR
ncbi:MAG: 2-oxoacid:ferredoxin oxidoreductase subunit beta [Deltaproteobacteria bacterium]|nr:2-oxoacid:ferredoxin oxidoreductase subunit beta [Deltaproteobacteria bacterium]MBW2140820.1 2-oxoacid:ferredoxin oxidoreductase subunit beta [Deltaproteobacteria bacterium]MBW2324419.1 2-oxoacid:ferredoxin oxidoreductase subunit beta [Deltaproteobacteria bacterium]